MITSPEGEFHDFIPLSKISYMIRDLSPELNTFSAPYTTDSWTSRALEPNSGDLLPSAYVCNIYCNLAITIFIFFSLEYLPHDSRLTTHDLTTIASEL